MVNYMHILVCKAFQKTFCESFGKQLDDPIEAFNKTICKNLETNF